MNIHRRYGRISTLAALMALATTAGVEGPPLPRAAPEPESTKREVNPFDTERIRAAEAKRARKAAKRVAGRKP